VYAAAYLKERWSIIQYKVNPTFIEEIKTKEFEDTDLNKIRNRMVFGEAQHDILDTGGVLSFRGRICVPQVDDSIYFVLEKSHG